MASQMRTGFLDLRRLRYFQAILRCGSLSAAAREVNIAQPALTHHIAEIERDLGAPVLVRHQSGVRPTALGELLASHAAEVLDRVARAERDLLAEARRGAPLDTLHLAIIPSLASALTPALIKGFARSLAGLDLHLIEARSGFGDRLIESGQADIAIQLVNPEDMTGEALIWETLFWITPREGYATPGPVSLKTVLEARLILPSEGNPLRGVVNLTRWRRGNGLFWSVRCSRRPSKRRRLRFDDSVLRLRNGGWRELRNGFGRQCGRLQTVATRPESEILACNALVFETVDGCFPPCCSSPCGNDVRDRMRLHVWPLRRIAACL